MTNGSNEQPPMYIGRKRPDEAVNQPPPPGQPALVMAGLAIGILLMGIQLWLLTIALELYLAGHGDQVWLTALVSGAIFAGGLLMLRLLRRRPRVRRTSVPETTRRPRR
jgi:hypothetical protein